MITEIHLQNFRGFEDHVVPLRPTTIVVGSNNAGKSTIVEALRLISIVVSRFKGELWNIPRHWSFPKNRKGMHPFKNLDINFESIFHFYGNPPAYITATFTTGEKIQLTISKEDITARCKHPKGTQTRQQTVSRVSIQPQVAPVSREERILTEDYVRGSISSTLAPTHFRNQLYLLSEYYASFKEAAEFTWPSLRIRNLDKNGKFPDPSYLSLFVEENHFSAEVAWMGHGLQMWLQTIWFLTRAKDHETVILDEPDVYMHADLQRRLVRFVKNRHQQIIIATHSSEIMAEVQPENILIVDRKKKKSEFATSIPVVQRVLNDFGSIHNLQLSRLWNSRRFLMVEGEDITFLKPIQNSLFPESQIPIDTIPSMPVGGWGGWNYVVGSDMFLENSGGEGIITYCIFDSDFFSEDEISKRVKEAQSRGISLHIWSRKELENYLLVPNAIQRIISRLLPYSQTPPSTEEIEAQIEKIAKQLKLETCDAIATQIQSVDKKLTPATLNQRAREILNNRWKSQEGRFGVISGKKALSCLSKWCQDKYKVSFGATTIANEIRAGEVHEELKNVIGSIERCVAFK